MLRVVPVTLVTWLALGIVGLVALPIVAHRLRRLRADEKSFAAARLVPAAPPRARRRAKLEDRALLSVRALTIALLALLGASPFVRCSRLSMQRSGGASVALAIVVDDSMSMRAVDGGKARFDRAKAAASDLLASMREGDSVAIVLAGAPARVELGATTDLGAAKASLDALSPSDRATDLDGALDLSRGLLSQLPQIDKRVVLLSDLADGNPGGSAFGESSAIPVWAPLDDLRGPASDCGLLAADRQGDRVKVKGACGPGASAEGRDVVIALGDATLAHAPAPSGSPFEVTLAVAKDAADGLVAKLRGADAIAADDVAPVLSGAGPASIAVVAEIGDESAATGGAPIVEQALAALRVELGVRPLPTLPDHDDDLAPFVALVLDDPPGLTPEERKALDRFLDRGGVVLLALGPRAAQAPLGATFEPMLSHATGWEKSASLGADPASAKSGFDDSAASLVDLAAPLRASLSADDARAFEPLLSWKDGPPLFARKPVARGETWVSTLPFSTGASDLVLRPGFLALLDAFTSAARAHSSSRRGDVGLAWEFPSATRVTGDGPAGPLAQAHAGGAVAIVPGVVGSYSITVDGRHEIKVAAPVQREMDLRPRALTPAAQSSSMGDTHAEVDASPAVAVLLLALLTLELVLRAWGPDRRAPA